MATEEPRLDPAQPWERQEGETALWYERFRHYYLSQKAPRSLNTAYIVYHRDKGTIEEKKGQSSGQWKRAASTHQWISRAEAYDLEQLRQEAKEEEAERLRARAQRRRIVDKLTGKLEGAVDRLKAKDLTPADISRISRVVLGQGRAEYNDLPEQRVRQSGAVAVATITEDAISEMTDEERQEHGRRIAQIILGLQSADIAYAGPRSPTTNGASGESGHDPDA
jgi:hypothetical protein